MLTRCKNGFKLHIPKINAFYLFIIYPFLSQVTILLADCTACGVIGSWHHSVVCLSVCPSVTLCIVALRDRGGVEVKP